MQAAGHPHQTRCLLSRSRRVLRRLHHCSRGTLRLMREMPQQQVRVRRPVELLITLRGAAEGGLARLAPLAPCDHRQVACVQSRYRRTPPPSMITHTRSPLWNSWTTSHACSACACMPPISPPCMHAGAPPTTAQPHNARPRHGRAPPPFAPRSRSRRPSGHASSPVHHHALVPDLLPGAAAFFRTRGPLGAAVRRTPTLRETPAAHRSRVETATPGDDVVDERCCVAPRCGSGDNDNDNDDTTAAAANDDDTTNHQP